MSSIAPDSSFEMWTALVLGALIGASAGAALGAIAGLVVWISYEVLKF